MPHTVMGKQLLPNQKQKPQQLHAAIAEKVHAPANVHQIQKQLQL